MMKRKVIVTRDGSSSVVLTDKNITYHSIHGALQESRHIYINNGLNFYVNNNKPADSVYVFEMGFGTGLNALLSLQYAIKQSVFIYYSCIEAFPLNTKEVEQLNYTSLLNDESLTSAFRQMHCCSYNAEVIIHPSFTFQKQTATMQSWIPDKMFNIIYYDAFAPDDAPDLWFEEIFKKLNKCMIAKALLITYCSKTKVRKALAETGFAVSKLPGPPGKREIMSAVKINEHLCNKD